MHYRVRQAYENNTPGIPFPRKKSMKRHFVLLSFIAFLLFTSITSISFPMLPQNHVFAQEGETDDFDTLEATGIKLYSDGLYFEAIDWFTKAFEAGDEKYTRPLDYRGRCHMRTFDYEKAEADFLRGLDINPDNGYIRMSLASLYYARGDFEKSKEQLDLCSEESQKSYPGLPSLLKGPFVDDYPGTYSKFEGMTTKKRYRLYSDVGKPSGEKLKQLQNAFVDADPKDPKVQKNKTWRKATAKTNEWKYIAHIQETMYDKYASFFAWKDKPQAIFKTFVFSDKEGYRKFTRSLDLDVSRAASGFYVPTYKILLLYNEIGESGARKGIGNEMINTLFHESLHQFLDQLISDVPIWFNEGVASYFEQSQLSTDGKRVEIGTFERDADGYVTRYEHVKEMIKDNRLWSWEDMIRISDEDWDMRALDGYAQAWSMIYFMMNQKDLKPILHKYFMKLRECKGNEWAIEQSFGDNERLKKMEKRWLKYMKKL